MQKTFNTKKFLSQKFNLAGIDRVGHHYEYRTAQFFLGG